MQCHHCHATLQLVDSLLEGHVRQSWYHCPLCGADQTVAQRAEDNLRRFGDTQRCSCAMPQPAAYQRGTG